VRRQVLHDFHNRLLNGALGALDVHLRRHRLLVRRANPRELLDLPRPRLFIQPLRIPPLRLLDADVHPHLHEPQRLLVRPGLPVQFPGEVPVGAVRRDEARDGDGARIREQPRDLGDAADVLGAVRGREGEVAAEAEAHVVAVEEVRGGAAPEEVLLERGRDGGLAGRRQAGQPDGRAALAGAEGRALGVGEAGVPGYVAACLVRGQRLCGRAYVAIYVVLFPGFGYSDGSRRRSPTCASMACSLPSDIVST
jgi:hypothetical protein